MAVTNSLFVMPAQDTPPLRGGDPVVAGIHVFLGGFP